VSDGDGETVGVGSGFDGEGSGGTLGSSPGDSPGVGTADGVTDGVGLFVGRGKASGISRGTMSTKAMRSASAMAPRTHGRIAGPDRRGGST
jgi:hypothetical protein